MKTPNNKKSSQQLEILLQQQAAKIAQLERGQAIEAAIERIRAKALAMHHSYEVKDVANAMRTELMNLGIAGVSAATIWIEQSKDKVRAWDFTNVQEVADSKDLEVDLVLDLEKGRAHPKAYFWNVWNNRYETYSVVASNKKVLYASFNWLVELDEAMGREMLHLADTGQLTYLWHASAAIAKGAITVDFVVPPPAEMAIILPKMAAAFDLAYRRFEDLQKAEAQTKEAQIEVALERVRARTMAMHKTEDLRAVVGVLYEQFNLLHLADESCNINIFKKDINSIESWMAGFDGISLPDCYYMEGIGHPFLKRMWETWKAQATPFHITSAGKELNDYVTYLLEETDLKRIPDDFKKLMLAPPELHFSFITFKYGQIEIVNTSAFPSQENLKVLTRFAKVFEQTYTRFLDLQKAEAQAREAQIEAALERVRAASMAMHQSDDLIKVSHVLREQMVGLGETEMEAINFHLYNDDQETYDAWFVQRQLSSLTEQLNEGKCTIDWNKTKRARRDKEMYLSDETDYTIVGDYEMLKEWYHYLDSIGLDSTNEHDGQGNIIIHNQIHYNYSKFTGGVLLLITQNLATTPSKNLLKRAAQVFDMAFLRFLDLQKAEAQAREAQIEAALERVRAATMAMHHSSELSDAVKVLFAQFQNLKIDTVANWIGFIDVAANTMEIWSTSGEKSRPAYTVNGADYHNFQADIDAFKNKKAYRQHSMERAMAIEVLQEQFELELNLPDEATHYHLLQMRHEFGFLGYGSWQEADAEVFPVLKRFCGVFEQTYTRFLDLQKAEERAREAQIEAALERVRSRAMAMRHSDELSEAAELLYREFFKLGVEPFSCGYLINDDEKGEWRIWLTNPGEPFFKEYWTIPYTADDNLQARYESWKNKEAFHCVVLEGAANQAHHQVICQYAPWKEEVTETLAAQLVFNSAHFSLGHLLVISPDRLTSELEQAMVRFAGVFDLTYRRFLDLEKAEAQNRQLEKVFNENQRLLHSILPEQIAEQIRKGQKTVVKRFEEVSILFADIVGFTILSEKLSPQKVVDILNGLFSKFDDLTDKYQLEKIKTIGDAYMVAAGVPEEKDNHAQLMFAFAKEMLQTLQDFNLAMGGNLKIRIGISSGPVVAGVIGKKKFAYDLWGDTVNTAARMEANGRADCIQVSPTTHVILKKETAFEKIPNVEIKGKGNMDVYLWTP